MHKGVIGLAIAHNHLKLRPIFPFLCYPLSITDVARRTYVPGQAPSPCVTEAEHHLATI